MRKPKRILSLMLSLVMILAMLPTNIVFAEIDSSIFESGNGISAETAYEIATLEQLKEFRDSVTTDGNTYEGKHIKLTADIDLKGSDSNKWTPIGRDGKPFKGSFDGNGKKIYNLYANSAYSDNYGFFGYAEDATIEKLTIASGKLIASSNVGGIVGYASKVNIKKCTNYAEIETTEYFAGGIAGEAKESSTISECINFGSVKANSIGGGIVGTAYGSDVLNCYNTGSVTANKIVGGIAGEAGIVEYCYNIGTVSASKDAEYVNGICGAIQDDEHLCNSFYLDSRGVDTTFTTERPATGIEIDANEFKLQDTFTAQGWDFDKVWIMDDERPLLRNNLEETGSEKSPYTISDITELKEFRDSVTTDGNNYEGKHIKLTADIDLKGSDSNQWTPIGSDGKPFKGSFDGGGHKIRGLYINDTTSNETRYQGLFGLIVNATIKNLTVDGSIYGKNMSYAGGIVGWASESHIENCWNMVNVTSDRSGYCSIGGIAGQFSGKMLKNCYNTGDISGGGNWIGGISGISDSLSMIENCYNTGKISTEKTTGEVQIGGIIGNGYYINLKNCYNYGTVTAPSGVTKVGGIFGSYTYGNGVTNEGAYYLDTAKGADTTFDCLEGTAKDANAFKSQDTFTGWDFDNVWIMDDERPLLRNNLEETGSEKYPYTISNITELEEFRDSVNDGNTYEGKHIKLTADIDLFEKYNSTTGISWTPIGNNANSFKGYFDGCGNKIEKLYINDTTTQNFRNQGLFGYI